jgi:hypothetical protein
MKEVECPQRTFDLEEIVRWAFANGYRVRAPGAY